MRSGAMTSEVSGIENESSRTRDTSSDAGIPGSRGIAGNTMVKGVEVRSVRRTVTRISDIIEDKS